MHWVDGNGHIIWANKAELDALGYQKEEYIGHHIEEFHADKKVIDDILNRLVNNETLKNYEAQLKCKDGSIKYVLINSNVLWDGDKFIHTRCFTRDITEIKESEKRKDEFLGTASHELKTPLTSIKAYVQLLERTLNDGDLKKANNYLNKTSIFVDKMNFLILKMLDLSKIQDGTLQCNFTEFNINTLIKNTIENMQQTINQQIVMHGKIEKNICGDPQRIEQVLTNLLSNAVKYSHDTDLIYVNLIDGDKEITISIQDFGIGIPQDKHLKIFDRFYRIYGQTKFNGFGIGLYITSEIIKRHKGKIWVESETGMGSTFYFTLPVE